ncbi:MAG: hypothetical protein K2X60_00035 [Xanthobacteraceae bacterium]|nr:hypothetical protein [Xanthobacteraceae bacterium]
MERRAGARQHADENRSCESVFAKQPKSLPVCAEIWVKPKISENNFIAKIRDSESAKRTLHGSRHGARVLPLYALIGTTMKVMHAWQWFLEKLS